MIVPLSLAVASREPLALNANIAIEVEKHFIFDLSSLSISYIPTSPLVSAGNPTSASECYPLFTATIPLGLCPVSKELSKRRLPNS